MVTTAHTRHIWSHAIVAILLIMAPVAMSLGQDSHASESTYTWHSELVELDTAGGTATLRNRILGYAEVDDLSAVSQGDHISLIWSGANGRASGIRGVKSHSAGEWNDPFAMPAAFVSTERDGAYLTFRLPIPTTGVEAIQSLESGEWVTLTGRQHPTSLDDVVIDARPYSS